MPFPTPGDLPDPGVRRDERETLSSLELAGGFFTTNAPLEAPVLVLMMVIFYFKTP